MAPNSTYLLTVTPDGDPLVRQEDIDKIKGGHTKIYVYGKGIYTDVFSCTHWETFCYFLNNDGKSWAGCGNYNDTGDDNCNPKFPQQNQ